MMEFAATGLSFLSSSLDSLHDRQALLEGSTDGLDTAQDGQQFYCQRAACNEAVRGS